MSRLVVSKLLGEGAKEDFIECKDVQEEPLTVPDVEHPVNSQVRLMCEQLDHD